MAHGYLGDGYGTHGEFDPDRGDERERGWRDREQDWRGRDRDRDRGMMFGGRERGWSDDDRWGERGSRGESYGREHGFGGFQGDYSGGRDQGGFGGFGDYSEGRRSFSAHPDDHYRSWRNRHMSELDRDYADYCREREQQFHRDFDDWRRNRGERGSGTAGRETGELELTRERALAEEGNAPSPTAEATLGTNNPENSLPGRGRGRR